MDGSSSRAGRGATSLLIRGNGRGLEKGPSTFVLCATCTGIRTKYSYATSSMGEGNRVDNWRSALEIKPKTEEASSGYVRGPAPHHPVSLRTLCIRLRRVP